MRHASGHRRSSRGSAWAVRPPRSLRSFRAASSSGSHLRARWSIDPKSCCWTSRSEGLQIELKRIQQEVGITFVYVTHDQEEALTMSDQIAVMNLGRVEQVADPETVYDRPTTSFVAGFIGVSNLMPAKVLKTGDSGEVQLEAGPVVSGSVDALSAGDSCHAIVRPEKLLIDDRSSALGEGLPSVDGVVESSLYLGTATQILVRLPGEVPMTVLVPNVSERERSSLPGAGAEVKLAWDPDNMHVVRDTTIVETKT